MARSAVAERVAAPAVEWSQHADPSSASALEDPVWLFGSGTKPVERVAVGADPPAPASPAVSVPRYEGPPPQEWRERIQAWVAPTVLAIGALVLLWILRHTSRRRRKRRRYRLMY